MPPPPQAGSSQVCRPSPLPGCSHSLVRPLPARRYRGCGRGWGCRCESLADTVARCPFRQSSVLSAVSQETWLVIPNFKETEMGILQRCAKAHGPGLASAERAEPVVDSSGQLIWTPGPEEGTGATLGEPSGVPDLGKKSTASWRQRSHTFLRQSQLSML